MAGNALITAKSQVTGGEHALVELCSNARKAFDRSIPISLSTCGNREQAAREWL